MSYLALFILIASGYILGAPIFHESLDYHIIECIPGENETLTKYVIEVKNTNETCIQINKTTATGHDVYFYEAPKTEEGVRIEITTEDCHTPLPELHLSICDDQPVSNHTEIMVTFGFSNVSAIEPLIDHDDDNSTTPTTPLYTGPVIFETLHHLDNDNNEEEHIPTNAPLNNLEHADDDSTSDDD